MATVAEAAGHIFLTSARFQELLAQGVISKAERGAYDVDVVRKEYILNIRKKASGRNDGDGLTEARADLAREQREQIALKNAVARGDAVPLEAVFKSVDAMITTVRERILSIPGKLATSIEMRSRDEVEELLRTELYEALDELSRPVAPSIGGDLGEDEQGGSAVRAAAASEPD